MTVIRENKNIYISKDVESVVKEYIFDSLVFRYEIARDKAAELEALQLKQEGRLNANETARNRAKRDKMRFIEILHEVIGEHY